MESEMEGFWSELPPEILERVLSFVPVPSLCRFRFVCREWRELLCKASFHDLCNLNGKKDKYLFVSRYLTSRSIEWRLVDPNCKRTLRFLDLDAGRWYSIENGWSLGDAESEGDTRVLAMDDGLVCELNHTYRDFLSCAGLVISNPVTKTRRALPAPPIRWGNIDDFPLIVPVVDKIARIFVVFLLYDYSDRREIGLHLFDSTTNEWRDLKNSPEELELSSPLSAVFFRGALYVLEASCYLANLRLLSYNLEENLWRELSVPLTAYGSLPNPELLVVDHRLIMMVWLIEPDSSYHHSYPPRRGLYHHFKYDASFQVLELLIDENSSRRLFDMPIETLRDHFGEELQLLRNRFVIGEDPVIVTCGVPSIDSNGLCISITLMSSSSGKLLTYDLKWGFGGGSPPHLLREGPFEDILEYPTGFLLAQTMLGSTWS